MDEPVEQFARLYDEHVWTVYGFFGYRLGSREDAEDLTQLTFERALKAWGRFDPARAGVGTWLLAIARNQLIDYHRADRSDRIEPLGDGLTPEYEPAAGLPDAALGLDPDLEAALDRLDDRERELLALRFGGDLNGPEIAGLTGLTLANVQQILSRTLRRLRYELETSSAASEAETAVLPGDPSATRQA
jgi:RNA polymerase sigma-70 factor (ECF subfamily)